MTTSFERNGPYEEVWVQLPKLKLRCPLVKPSVTTGLMEAKKPVLRHKWTSCGEWKRDISSILL